MSVLMVWLRFPGGLLFGSMAGSGILHGTGFVHAVLPWWLGSSAVIVLGAVAGARFANTSPRVVLDYLGAAFGSFAVSVSVGGVLRLHRDGVPAVPDRRRGHRLCAGLAGPDDAARARAPSRPGLCRRAPSGALAGGDLLDRRVLALGRGQTKPHERSAGGAAGEGTFDD